MREHLLEKTYNNNIIVGIVHLGYFDTKNAMAAVTNRVNIELL